MQLDNHISSKQYHNVVLALKEPAPGTKSGAVQLKACELNTPKVTQMLNELRNQAEGKTTVSLSQFTYHVPDLKGAWTHSILLTCWLAIQLSSTSHIFTTIMPCNYTTLF